MLTLSIDWESTVASLADSGWTYLPGAAAEVVDALQASRPHAWERETIDEAGISAYSKGSGRHWPNFGPDVTAVADDLLGNLSDVAETRGLPRFPAFNEVSWNLYPQGEGHISAHRDPLTAGGVIAIFTLEGSATFHVTDDGGSYDHEARPGDLVLLRGSDWPTPDLPRPLHGVEAPTNGDRVIMTFRCNTRGAGAPWFD